MSWGDTATLETMSLCLFSVLDIYGLHIAVRVAVIGTALGFEY